MLVRVLEPEVMDSPDEARDYDAMDHAEVNAAFVCDLMTAISASRTTIVHAASPGWHALSEAKGVGTGESHALSGRATQTDPPTPFHVLDVGTGTARIPIELCRQAAEVHIVAIDLARHMLELAEKNVAAAGFAERIELRLADAKALPFDDARFDVVMSNSIVHHIPEPLRVIEEMVRVAAQTGLLFVRDLLRPADEATLQHLVQTYAGGANAHQQAMFAASLRAALSVEELWAIVQQLGFAAETVQQTSDRHWTWTARR